MDTAAKALTEELSRVAKEIQNASFRLQKEFNEAPEIYTSEGERSVPDPVKLIRRICALERSISLLTDDCEKIAKSRSQIAPLVMQTQQDNVALVSELSQSFPEALSEPKENLNEENQEEAVSEVEEWASLAEKLDEQAKFFLPPEQSDI